MSRVVLGLGGNLGDPRSTMDQVIEILQANPRLSLAARSSYYRSHALTLSGVDPSEPEYLNCVVIFETELEPLALLDYLNQLEAQFGRERHERWAARTLDIDIISYGNQILSSPRLTLPHPSAGQRAFVMVPWAEIAPEDTLLGSGRVSELAAALRSEVWMER